LERVVRHIPRWSYLVAVCLIGALLSILSENLTIGPTWLVPAISAALLIPQGVAIVSNHHEWTRRLAFIITSFLTVGLITSVIFLINALFRHMASASAISLIRNAGSLWVVNVVLFAIWYWEVDRGGPTRRHAGLGTAPDLLFPQMAMELEGWRNWKPTFSDYAFLSFNTSTAFSPTDTLVLSTRAKILMMVQSSISLIIVAVLAARAINIA